LKAEDPEKDWNKGLGMITRIGVDLVAGTLVGTVLGYLADRALGTKPWLMVAGIFLGAAAGFRNIFRYLQDMEKKGDG
jgi:ATP synthase protein I